MSANENNLNEAKRAQKEEFNKRLLAAMALKQATAKKVVDEVDGNDNETILVKIVKKKYEFIEKFDQSEQIKIQRSAELQ